MVSLPQLQRDLHEVEAQLRFTRNRLTFYELLDEQALASHTRDVVASLENLQHSLTSRIHAHAHQKA
jgi:hypothetical protein